MMKVKVWASLSSKTLTLWKNFIHLNEYAKIEPYNLWQFSLFEFNEREILSFHFLDTLLLWRGLNSSKVEGR